MFYQTNVMILVWTVYLCVFAHVQAISVEPRFCPSDEVQEEVFGKVITTPAPDVLEKVAEDEVNKKRLDILPGVHFYINYALSNVVVIDAPDGLILVDAMDSATALKPILEDVAQLYPNKTFKAILYTHHHPDHVGGAIEIKRGQLNDQLEVWGHEALSDEFWAKWQFIGALFTARSWRQLGVDLPEGAFVSTGIGPGYVVDETTGLLLVPPTHLLTSEEMDVNIAGINMTLMKIPGETDDHIGVYIPSLQLFVIGDDLYKSYPNLYSIRGTKPRPVLEWARSCDKVSQLDIEYLLPCHTEPIIGKAVIQQTLQMYSDGIKYVHDQTTRLMNRGLHPDVIAQTLKLPDALRNDSYLTELYGRVEWGSKGVFESRVGWFSGLVEELFPPTPQEEAETLVELLRYEEVVSAVENRLRAGTEKDLRVALKLTSIYWQARESLSQAKMDNETQEILALRSQAIMDLAALQTSGNARNYLLRYVLEENCNQTNQSPSFTQLGAIMILEAPKLLEMMTIMLKSEDLDDVSSTNVLRFNDVGRTFSLTIRHNVMNVAEQDSTNPDVIIDVALAEFRQVLSLAKTLEEAGATVFPSIEAGNEFMSYFDDPRVIYF